jgi:hypothetical protein
MEIDKETIGSKSMVTVACDGGCMLYQKCGETIQRTDSSRLGPVEYHTVVEPSMLVCSARTGNYETRQGTCVSRCQDSFHSGRVVVEI